MYGGNASHPSQCCVPILLDLGEIVEPARLIVYYTYVYYTRLCGWVWTVLPPVCRSFFSKRINDEEREGWRLEVDGCQLGLDLDGLETGQDQKEKGVEEEQRVRECGEDMIGRKGTQ